MVDVKLGTGNSPYGFATFLTGPCSAHAASVHWPGLIQHVVSGAHEPGQTLEKAPERCDPRRGG